MRDNEIPDVWTSDVVYHIHDIHDVEPQAKQLQEEGPELPGPQSSL